MTPSSFSPTQSLPALADDAASLSGRRQRSRQLDWDFASCATCESMVADEFPACPLCGGFLRAPNMVATPFKWLTIAFSGLAVYGTLAFAILRVLHS